MYDAKRLRTRLLSALGATLAVSAGAVSMQGCSGNDLESLEQPLCGQGTSTSVTCYPRGQTHFNDGNGGAGQTPDPIFDENRCQVVEQVRDGCCNAAKTGPKFIDGECCYGFCTGVCCGRPILCDGELRIASVAVRSDWLAPSMPLRLPAAAQGEAADERSKWVLSGALGSAWLSDALLEHASIGSFARFSLDLLAFGAPAEFVEDAARAMADEIRHARVCFELARRYSGEAFGPDKLDLAGVTASKSLLKAAVGTVREGCVEETVSALVASARARAATDPHVRGILERIAEDEARHAELAFRFVRWAIETGGDEVRSAVKAAFALLAVPDGVSSDVDGADEFLAAHGFLPESELLRLRRAALLEVVGPCARAISMGSEAQWNSDTSQAPATTGPTESEQERRSLRNSTARGLPIS